MKTSLLEAISPTARALLATHKPKVKKSKVKFYFRAEMTKQREQVLDAFDLYGNGCGDDLTVDQAISDDWTHLLVQEVADVLQLIKREGSDDNVGKLIARELATIAALCEMWADQLEAE